MTKGRAVLPGKWWRNRSRFNHLGGRRHLTPLSKNISKKGPLTADLSTALRSGRDDKGEGGASGKVVAEQEPFFITLGGPKAMTPLSKNISKKGRNRRSLHYAALRSR